MESYDQSTKKSKWNLRPDADITNRASEILKKFPAALIHVKSHQDNDTDFDKLSFPAQLNVMADAQATARNTSTNVNSGRYSDHQRQPKMDSQKSRGSADTELLQGEVWVDE
jgi:hypothetical protein